MPVLNLADAIYAGTGVVSAIYYGSTEVYNIGGGPDPEPTPTIPVPRGNWNASGARGTVLQTTNALPPGTQVGDTAFAVIIHPTASAPPTGGPVTWETTPIASDRSDPQIDIFRGTVTSTSGSVTKSTATGTSLLTMLGVYAGDVDVAASLVSRGGVSGTMTLTGISAPANSLAVAVFAPIFVEGGSPASTLNTSGWADRGGGSVNAGSHASTRFPTRVGDRQFETAAATGSVSATISPTPGAGPGYVGIVMALVNA